MDNRKEVNIAIAELLGFKQTGEHWAYPPLWEDEITGSPQRTIPDFVEMIDRYKQLGRLLRYGIPRQHLNR